MSVYIDKKSNFVYYNNKKEEPIEGPIFSQNGSKIIAQGRNLLIKRDSSVGVFLNYPIKEFIQKFNK